MNQEIKEKLSTLSRSYDFSVCPTCKGSGWILREETDIPEMIETYGEENEISNSYAYPCPTCKGGHIEKVETAKKNSNIPIVYYDSVYSSFKWDIYKDSSGKTIDLSNPQKGIESYLRNYKKCKSKGYGLYIYSKTKGSGKTFLASCLCNELMELYAIRTRFVSASNLLDIAQSGDKTSPDEYKREPIKLLCNCELLVVDDIGQKKNGQEWMSDIMYKIADERFKKQLSTIYTSNLKVDELNLNEATIERMKLGIFLEIKLPEFNVRSRESYNEKVSFMKEIGLLKGGDEDN